MHGSITIYVHVVMFSSKYSSTVYRSSSCFRSSIGGSSNDGVLVVVVVEEILGIVL